MTTKVDVTQNDVRGATRRLHEHLSPTPVVRNDRFDAWLKLESLQTTGSYKVRGALNALLCRPASVSRIVAASAGNHARGVAWACRRLGLQATLVMPNRAPRTKVDGTRELGAQVLLEGETFEDARTFATSLAMESGAYLLDPFDDPAVIAGQGSVGVELSALNPDVVLVPIGGGGLAAGVGLALPHSRVVGVQLAGLDRMARVLSNRPYEPLPPRSIADGVQVREPGHLTRRICETVLDDIVIVTEEEVRRAMLDLLSHARVVAEGAGALTVAALAKVPGQRRTAVVSGGNVDLTTVHTLMSERTSTENSYRQAMTQRA